MNLDGIRGQQEDGGHKQWEFLLYLMIPFGLKNTTLTLCFAS